VTPAISLTRAWPHGDGCQCKRESTHVAPPSYLGGGARNDNRVPATGRIGGVRAAAAVVLTRGGHIEVAVGRERATPGTPATARGQGAGGRQQPLWGTTTLPNRTPAQLLVEWAPACVATEIAIRATRLQTSTG
jgi:hypothetical protein